MINNNERDSINSIKSILKEQQIYIDVPMKEHTSMRVGGLAKILVLPSSCHEIIEVKKTLHHLGIPHYIMGNGTNLIVGDDGYPGVIIKLADNFSNITVQGDQISAMAGASLAVLSNTAMKSSLSGLEFAAGIPGTVGGAVAMNAGAYDGEMKDVVVETVCMDETGEVQVLQGDAHEFGYRTSRIQKRKLIVLKVKMKLIRGESEHIQEKMRVFNNRRREKQPLSLPSAGSAFKRPKGFYAGKLIEDAGLKGYQIGGARVSEKHCGFVVNVGNATATDIIQLLDHIQKKVYQSSGVMLEPEVRILGG